jgi:hypothetical protein
MADLTGRQFGMLTVLRRAGSFPNGKGTNPGWLVRCRCGTEKRVRAGNLTTGRSTSCGCALTRHGMYGTPEYAAWTSIRQRCENPRARSFPNYGARGIRVCPRWRASFEAFLADMGRRPTPRHSVDRIDNGSDYTPDNCRWATPTEQQRNKRTTRLLEADGRVMSLAAWAEETGIGRTTITERIRRGWSVSRAVTTPPGQ